MWLGSNLSRMKWSTVLKTLLERRGQRKVQRKVIRPDRQEKQMLRKIKGPQFVKQTLLSVAPSSVFHTFFPSL